MMPCAPAGRLDEQSVDIVGSVAIAWALISTMEDVPATTEVRQSFDEGRAAFLRRLEQAGLDGVLVPPTRSAEVIALSREIAFRQIPVVGGHSQSSCKGGTMAKQPKNHGKTWTETDVSSLRKLAKENTPTRVIALKIGRTPESVQSKASEKNISLKPTNQSPYGRRKK